MEVATGIRKTSLTLLLVDEVPTAVESFCVLSKNHKGRTDCSFSSDREGEDESRVRLELVPTCQAKQQPTKYQRALGPFRLPFYELLTSTNLHFPRRTEHSSQNNPAVNTLMDIIISSKGISVRIRFGSPFSSQVVVCGHCVPHTL